MKVAALIPAAGSGTRLGLGPKAFVEVAGLSLLARSVAALAPHVDEVVVALPEGWTLPAAVPARAIVGGQTRQDSVRLLLEATGAEAVLVHDAARPFLPAEVVRAVLAAAWEVGAATAALPVARWVEYQTGVPYIEEIIDPPFALDAEGMLRVPTGPGLGITLNRDAIARFSPKS